MHCPVVHSSYLKPMHRPSSPLSLGRHAASNEHMTHPPKARDTRDMYVSCVFTCKQTLVTWPECVCLSRERTLLKSCEAVNWRPCRNDQYCSYLFIYTAAVCLKGMGGGGRKFYCCWEKYAFIPMLTAFFIWNTVSYSFRIWSKDSKTFLILYTKLGKCLTNEKLHRT